MKKILEEGDFYIGEVETSILGKKLDKWGKEDLKSFNSLQLNVSFNLIKIPGKETVTRGSLVNSEVLEVNAPDYTGFVNDFLVSKINTIVQTL